MSTKRTAAESKRFSKARKEMLLSAKSLKELRGPDVAVITLKKLGAMVMIRRDFSLLSVALDPETPRPIADRIAEVVHKGALNSEHFVGPRKMQGTMTAFEYIARKFVVLPPDDFIAGKVDEDEIRAADCLPMFVEKGPQEGQIVLGEGEDKLQIHVTDLARIADAVERLGPGVDVEGVNWEDVAERQEKRLAEINALANED